MPKALEQRTEPLVLVTYVCPSASEVSSISSLLGVNLDSLKVRETSQDVTIDPGKRYVYGLKGIQELFNVSHLTAQRYKDGILKEAVFQSGRKIVVDADKAIELFNERRGR